MKTFLYTKTTGKRSRVSGGCTVTFYIYRMKRNEPVYLGETSANTASYPGDQTQVRRFLADHGHLPKMPMGAYYSTSDKFKLFNV